MNGLEGETAIAGLVLLGAAPWVLIASGRLRVTATAARKAAPAPPARPAPGGPDVVPGRPVPVPAERLL